MTYSDSTIATAFYRPMQGFRQVVGRPLFLSWAALVLALIVPAAVQAQTALTYVADLSPAGKAEARASSGRITLELDKVNDTLRFELSVIGVDRVVSSHFHRVRWQTMSDGTRVYLDPIEGDGPTVGYFLGFDAKGLAGNGVIAKGVINRTRLMAGFSRRPLDDLIKHLDAGHFYATVHAPVDRDKGVFCCPTVLRGFFRPARTNQGSG